MTPGIHLMHKPVGPTSFSLVQKCLQSAPARPGRRPLRICHGGTLDPFAGGLLLMLVEPATRLFDYLHAIPKTYEATVRWGIETDNGDPLGKTIFTGDASSLDPRRLESALQTFVGWREQTPPATSAKRVDGVRAYEKVHRGEFVEMQPTSVYLHEARWLSHDLPRESRLRITVRGGYYVRALGRDLGKLLGCGAHLSELRRTSIGPWRDPGIEQSVELHGRDLLPWAQTRILSDQDVGDLRKGQAIQEGALQPPDWALPDGFPEPRRLVRGFHGGKFCFLLSRENGQLKVITALTGGL
jgi:tRNA pseudouridine55 synthase